MSTLTRDGSVLLLIDFQERLMPAIAGGEAVVANAGRLRAAAGRLGVPVVQTEQNPRGLGPTVPELAPGTAGESGAEPLVKMEFDACRAAGLVDRLPAGADVVVAGCEAHVCVLQTALGLLERGRGVYVVADAVGSRRPESTEAALRRLERHGAEVVTTEMVVFEWLGTAADPEFKPVVALIK